MPIIYGNRAIKEDSGEGAKRVKDRQSKDIAKIEKDIQKCRSRLGLQNESVSPLMSFARSFLEGAFPINEFDVGNGEEADAFDSTGEEDTVPTTADAQSSDDTPIDEQPTEPASDTQDDGEGTGDGDETVDFTDDGGDDDAPTDDISTDDAAMDGGEDDTEVDYTLDDTDDTGTEENPDGGEAEEPPVEGKDGEGMEGQEDDTSVDFTGDDDASGEGEGMEGDDSDFTDDSTSDAGDDSFNGLKDIERELFDNLTDEQKNIKIKELKQNFADLHEKCDGIIEILTNTTPSDESTVRVFDYIQKALMDLQNNVKDYLAYTFNTKTYIENDAQFKTYLVILSTIQKILDEINVQNNS